MIDAKIHSAYDYLESKGGVPRHITFESDQTLMIGKDYPLNNTPMNLNHTSYRINGLENGRYVGELSQCIYEFKAMCDQHAANESWFSRNFCRLDT